MNAVVYYSNTGQSRSIAAYLADQVGFPLVNIEAAMVGHYQDLVLVFPVHCQNIPDPVKAFLKEISADYLTVVATYGKMCCGNVIHEIQNAYQKNIIAAAYVPTKHAYIDQDDGFRDFEKLEPLTEKIHAPSYIRIPKIYKNPLADISPKLRSRLGLAIRKSADCIGCGLCAENCALGAIRLGKTNSRCIRCLKCVDRCPQHALTVQLSLPLKLYLSKKAVNKLIIYV